jgi:hypothetical protein
MTCTAQSNALSGRECPHNQQYQQKIWDKRRDNAENQIFAPRLKRHSILKSQ